MPNLHERAEAVLQSLETMGQECFRDWEYEADIGRVETALAQERERCAKLAEGWPARLEAVADPKYQQIRSKAATAIAAAIRRRADDED